MTLIKSLDLPEEYIYVAVSDIEDLIGDLVTSRKFTNDKRNGPITLAMVERAIKTGSSKLINDLSPLVPPTIHTLTKNETPSQETISLRSQLKSASKYVCSIAALDTISLEADQTAGEDKKPSYKQTRKSEYKATYGEYIFGIKKRLMSYTPETNETKPEFFVGKDFPISTPYRGRDFDLREYPAYQAGWGPIYR